MAEPHVVTALVRKRAEVKRTIDAAERRLARLRADLIHLDAALRLFQRAEGEPDGDDAPERVRRPRRWFRNGELARRVLDELRGAGGEPLTAVEVAARVMTAKGLDPDDVPSRILVRRSVNGYLLRRPNDGLVERVLGEGRAMRWRVAVPMAAE